MAARWLPGPLRARAPEVIRATYTVWEATLPPDAPARFRAGLPAAAEVEAAEPGGMPAALLWHTEAAVYGLVRRTVTERIEVRTVSGPPVRIELRCRPQGHHDAHAAGFAGVLALAACGALAGPQAFGSILLGGGFIAAYARELGMAALERRLRAILDDIGSALWPGIPAEVNVSRLYEET